MTPKVYSYNNLTITDVNAKPPWKTKKTLNGVSKVAVDKGIPHNGYFNVWGSNISMVL